MHTQFINKNRIMFFLLLIIATLVVVKSLNNNNINDSISYGDNFVLQNYVDDNGNEVNSALVIYDKDFKNVKSSKILDEVYDRVDQIDMNQDTVDSGEVHLMLYNSKNHSNKQVVIDLRNNELLLVDSEKKDKLNADLQIGIGSDETDMLLELAKKDYYKVIKDPNFINDGKYYTLVDFEQLTNYVK